MPANKSNLPHTPHLHPADEEDKAGESGIEVMALPKQTTTFNVPRSITIQDDAGPNANRDRELRRQNSIGLKGPGKVDGPARIVGEFRYVQVPSSRIVP